MKAVKVTDRRFSLRRRFREAGITSGLCQERWMEIEDRRSYLER